MLVVEVSEQIVGVCRGFHFADPLEDASLVRPPGIIRLLHHQFCKEEICSSNAAKNEGL